jgi:hypothetical protein
VVAFLAACDGAPQATPHASTSTVAPTATQVGAMSTTPEPEEKLEARITDFQVWQDYMPVVPPGGPPLHGVVTLEITYTAKLTPQNIRVTVTLTRQGNESIARDVPLTLQQQADDLGLLTPGPQTATLVLGPVQVQEVLTEGELIGGTVTLQVHGETIQETLPAVALFFTH